MLKGNQGNAGVTVLKHRFLCRWYPEVRTQGFTNVDGTIAFYRHLERYSRDAHTIVNFGCGRGEAANDPIALRRSLLQLRRENRHVIGLDLDPVGAENPLIDEFRIIKPGESWPLEAESVDLIISDWVAEHLECPAQALREGTRVLRKGGAICIRTPNLFGYNAATSRLVPNAFHKMIVKIAEDGRGGKKREECDVFPTYYRANTPRRLRQLLREAGFRPTIICHEAEPAYLSFSSVAYALGVLYQRHAPSWARNTIFAFGQKP